MDVFRKLLFPFALLYGLVTDIRNFLFDQGILKSSFFDVPVIAVGNLSVGGTGKSPQVEYLIRLLSPDRKVAVLSRGYKRATSGFILADAAASAQSIGDEPYQFYNKFPDIIVAVDADRTNGITQLLKQKPGVILLDDAFQHRKVKAGLYILLTAFDDLYADDFLLPMGSLRESRRGADRANIVIVTKCPRDLTGAALNEIREKLSLKPGQQLYFTFIGYDDFVFDQNGMLPVSSIRDEQKVLLAGIAKPKPFFSHLRSQSDDLLEFADHHAFTEDEIQNIKAKARGKKIVTTEKDYVRLKDRGIGNLYYLPIRTTFISGAENFDDAILAYVNSAQKV